MVVETEAEREADSADEAGRVEKAGRARVPPLPAPERPAPEPGEQRAGEPREHHVTPGARRRLWRLRLSRIRLVSPLTKRILALNVVALAILVAGLLYLGEYKRSLVVSELDSLTTQALIFGGALGESAIIENADDSLDLLPDVSRTLIRRLIEPTTARARLFAPSGELLADSRYLGAPGGAIQVEPLPWPDETSWPIRLLNDSYERIMNAVPRLGKLPRYREQPQEKAGDYPEVLAALEGGTARQVYDNGRRGLILSVAVPVQRYKQVVGALMVSSGSAQIDKAMRSVRLDILEAFAVALLITVCFSLYLGGAIVRPLRKLAEAAERLGPGAGRHGEIPDLTGRHDEIGDLSGALRGMTEALQQRMNAIERFAADVAHEIKNPLSSLRSAVETAARVKDPEQQRMLMGIIFEDVQRLDRLISDISEASRLDAELSRGTAETVDLVGLLETLIDIHDLSDRPDAVRLELAPPPRRPLLVSGIEGRLAQVFRNLIENALSFSPAGGVIKLALRETQGRVEAVIEDSGPGIPESSLETIFERFYSERPRGEKFGTHSGLGLSISKQIVEAHAGGIRAENRYDRDGHVLGARFIVSLRLEQRPVAAAANGLPRTSGTRKP
jgi:two-component system sensor histidine kinase ChvG